MLLPTLSHEPGIALHSSIQTHMSVNRDKVLGIHYQHMSLKQSTCVLGSQHVSPKEINKLNTLV
jgi:hypothetical protein